MKAAEKSGIPKNRVYLLALPKEATNGQSDPAHVRTLDQLLEDGSKMPPLEKLTFEKGQGAKQTAFLCYSSGTSGLPVHISLHPHRLSANQQFATERGHDLAPERNSKHYADGYVRETKPRF